MQKLNSTAWELYKPLDWFQQKIQSKNLLKSAKLNAMARSYVRTSQKVHFNRF